MERIQWKLQQLASPHTKFVLGMKIKSRNEEKLIDKKLVTLSLSTVPV
jgi:hypothetical protein